jgi:hypothetical protein
MESEMSEPVSVDPYNVPEILCAGKFNVSSSSAGFITFTFTHPRPKVGPLLDAQRVEDENVVRARIVTTIDNAIALRDILESMIKSQHPRPEATRAGSSKLN